MPWTGTATITPPAGVWTDDVGVITGEIDVETTCADDGGLLVRVRYHDAAEWYVLRGGRGTLADPADAAVVHEVLCRVLHREVIAAVDEG